MKKLIQQMCATLNDGQDFVLVTVASQSGSTPRLAGAKMMIRRDGSIVGTIGGGLVEAQAMTQAKACLQSGQSQHCTFDLSNHDAAVSDMICGGRMDLFLEFIAADDNNKAVFCALREAMNAGRTATLVCPLAPAGTLPRFILDHKGAPSRTDIPEDLIAAIKMSRSPFATTHRLDHLGQPYLLSSFSVGGNLFLIGAGHVSACTAEAAAKVGFRVIVMDDRIEFANRERFPLAEEIAVLPNFSGCFQDYDIDSDCYLVIVTRGHMHDMDVLEQALHTKAGYIGMIGSRRKRNTLYAKLMDKGITEAQLEQVRCPIGMAIEADTPEEIAVSIVGELIYQRATGRKAWHLA